MGFSDNLVEELVLEDESEFQAMFRLNVGQFEHILNLVESSIAAEDTQFRQSISPRLKLQVTIRYLATGKTHNNYMSIL